VFTPCDITSGGGPRTCSRSVTGTRHRAYRFAYLTVKFAHEPSEYATKSFDPRQWWILPVPVDLSVVTRPDWSQGGLFSSDDSHADLTYNSVSHERPMPQRSYLLANYAVANFNVYNSGYSSSLGDHNTQFMKSKLTLSINSVNSVITLTVSTLLYRVRTYTYFRCKIAP